MAKSKKRNTQIRGNQIKDGEIAESHLAKALQKRLNDLEKRVERLEGK